MFDKPIIYHAITVVNTLFMYCPKNRTKIKKTSKSIAKYALKCYNIHKTLYIGVASMPTKAVNVRKGVETMGLRFRKSIKIGSGAKLNINKKSVGMSVGGKGARYTVNSSGRRTKSVGIPGTGLSYVSTSGDKYHNKSCRYYDDTCTPMTLQDAQNAGYKPCKVCGG